MDDRCVRRYKMVGVWKEKGPLCHVRFTKRIGP